MCFWHLSLKPIKYQFQESLQEIGCTVPFFKNKDHICNDTEKAEKALEFYKKMMHKHDFKECLKPCHYLKAYLILSQHVDQDFRRVVLKFGDDSIQMTSAFEARLWRTKPVCWHWRICWNVPRAFFLSIEWFIKLYPLKIILNKVCGNVAFKKIDARPFEKSTTFLMPLKIYLTLCTA